MLRRLFSRGSSLFSCCCCWHKRLRRARCTFRKSEERESSSSAPAKRRLHLLQPFLFAHPFLNATLAAEWLNYKRAKPGSHARSSGISLCGCALELLINAVHKVTTLHIKLPTQKVMRTDLKLMVKKYTV